MLFYFPDLHGTKLHFTAREVYFEQRTRVQCPALCVTNFTALFGKKAMVILPVKVLCSAQLSFIMYYSSGTALLHCIRLHCSNLHLKCRAYPCTVPYSTELHWNCDALHCTALNYTELHWTTLQCTLPHCTALHWTTLYCPALHSPALSCTALHLDILHCTALHMLYWYQRKFNKEIIMS